MRDFTFPVIDPIATGKNIRRLSKERGISVAYIQEKLAFSEPRAIYKWFAGTIPSIDNLLALSRLFQVPIDEMIVVVAEKKNAG